MRLQHPDGPIGLATSAYLTGARDNERLHRRMLAGANSATIFGLLTLVVLLVTAIPYVIAYRTAPAGWHFMGILLNVPDTAQYLSWARESSQSFLIQDKLTSEPGSAVYFNLFFLVVGHLAVRLHTGYGEALQLVRVVTGAAFLWTIYWFTGLFFRKKGEHWTAALLVIFGSGLGWMLVVQKLLTHANDVASPLDIYVVEANTFLSVLAVPLQAMAGTLVLLVFGCAAAALERRSYRSALLAGLASLLLAMMHGYDLIVVDTVLAVVVLILLRRGEPKSRLVGLMACIGGFAVPAELWNLAITRLDPIWRGMLAQYGNAGVYSPPPLHVLVLMGLPLIVALGGVVFRPPADVPAGVRQWLWHAPVLDLILLSWFILGAVLIYIPTDYQIKMFVDWQVPIAVYATRTVFRFVFASRRRGVPVLSSRRGAVLLAIAVLAASLPTTVYLYSWRMTDLARHDYPYYLQTGDVAALNWLQAHSESNSVVLSSLTIGQYIPSQSGNRAFLAHWADTLDYFAKREAVHLFFDPALATDSFRQSLLETYNVDYIFYGTAERELGPYDPGPSNLARPVYSNSTVTIYQVTHENGSAG